MNGVDLLCTVLRGDLGVKGLRQGLSLDLGGTIS
jgi:hypothetical protein